jgi:hypothetical protein
LAGFPTAKSAAHDVFKLMCRERLRQARGLSQQPRRLRRRFRRPADHDERNAAPRQLARGRFAGLPIEMQIKQRAIEFVCSYGSECFSRSAGRPDHLATQRTEELVDELRNEQLVLGDEDAAASQGAFRASVHSEASLHQLNTSGRPPVPSAATWLRGPAPTRAAAFEIACALLNECIAREDWRRLGHPLVAEI